MNECSNILKIITSKLLGEYSKDLRYRRGLSDPDQGRHPVVTGVGPGEIPQ